MPFIEQRDWDAMRDDKNEAESMYEDVRLKLNKVMREREDTETEVLRLTAVIDKHREHIDQLQLTDRVVFGFDYSWVNDGEPSSVSEPGRAIQHAYTAAMAAELWTACYNAESIRLSRLECPKDHRPEACAHWRVEFLSGKEIVPGGVPAEITTTPRTVDPTRCGEPYPLGAGHGKTCIEQTGHAGHHFCVIDKAGKAWWNEGSDGTPSTFVDVKGEYGES